MRCLIVRCGLSEVYAVLGQLVVVGLPESAFFKRYGFIVVVQEYTGRLAVVRRREVCSGLIVVSHYAGKRYQSMEGTAAR